MKKFLLPLLLLSSLRLSAQLTILNCPSGTVEFCDNTPNSETHFNNGATDLCEGTANLSIEVSDSCPDFNPTVNYTLYLDLDHNGSLETVMNNSSPNAFAVVKTTNGSNTVANLQIPNDAVWGGQLPYGTHKMKWQVMSNCAGGSPATCSHFLYVHDCKKPTVVCFNGLSVNLLNSNPPMVQVWASEVLNYGFDNCTPSWDLKYRIKKATDPPGLPGPDKHFVQYDCDDIGTNIVELWAGDDNQTPADSTDDNWGFCTTYIIVQDNMWICSFPPPGGPFTLCCFYDGEPMSKITWDISSSNPAQPPLTILTDECLTSAVPLLSNYLVCPGRDENPKNGITTLDMIRIQKHIFGIQPFTDPYQYIAADVNRSKSITTFDLIELNKLLTGVNQHFTNNTSWRFVLEDYVFPPPFPPFGAFWNSPECIQIADAVGPEATNFYGIKIGDLNYSANANFQNGGSSDDRSSGILPVGFFDEAVRAGEAVTVPITAGMLPAFLASNGLAGYQLALQFDPVFLEFSSLVPGSLPDMGMESFGLTEVGNGLVRAAWFSLEKTQLQEGEPLFTLTFKVLQNGRLSQMLGLAENDLAAEAYGHDDSIWKIELQINPEAGASGYPGYFSPNPFADFSDLFFKMPQPGKASLTLTDAAGRRVYFFEKDYPAGEHCTRIFQNDLPAAGLYFFEMSTPGGRVAGKVVAR